MVVLGWHKAGRWVMLMLLFLSTLCGYMFASSRCFLEGQGEVRQRLKAGPGSISPQFADPLSRGCVSAARTWTFVHTITSTYKPQSQINCMKSQPLALCEHMCFAQPLYKMKAYDHILQPKIAQVSCLKTAHSTPFFENVVVWAAVLWTKSM